MFGEWRNATQETLAGITSSPDIHPSKRTTEKHNQYCDYFSKEGALHGQLQVIL
jgi:hypothetical protein